MPTWNGLLNEAHSNWKTTYDTLRHKYLAELQEHTGRNVITYYSGWLQKREFIQHGAVGFDINDNDKNGLMATIHKLDRQKGLDLILHTPRGNIAATESIVDYLRQIGKNSPLRRGPARAGSHNSGGGVPDRRRRPDRRL